MSKDLRKIVDEIEILLQKELEEGLESSEGTSIIFQVLAEFIAMNSSPYGRENAIKFVEENLRAVVNSFREEGNLKDE